MDLAKKYGLLQRLIFSGTVSADIREELPEVYQNVEIFINCDMLVPEIMDRMEARQLPCDDLLKEALRHCQGKGFRVMNLYYRLCTPSVVEAARGLGIGLSAWTVNTEEWIQTLLPHGLHNMTSRKPMLVKRLAE